jgi:uncharacterized protein
MNLPIFFLDVNVPMYAAGKAHSYQDACSWVMTQIAEGKLSVAIDTEIIQEVLYRYGSLREWSIATSMSTNLLKLVPTIYSVTQADIRRAVQLFSDYGPRGITARDLIHVAVMQNHGLTQIISTDAHFDRIVGITRLDPQILMTRTDH